MPVIDCDGHLVESIPEMAEFMEPGLKDHALSPSRNRQGVFPSLDGIHYPNIKEKSEAKPRGWIGASDYRKGSGEDCLAFVEKAGIEETVLFPSEGLSVGNIQLSDYAARVCRAYNDYVAYRFRQVSHRLHPMALIPMQVPEAAVAELRRAVKELGLSGAMLPATGLPLHLAHEYYWPVYQAAADLGCVLGIHGGSNRGLGIDTIDSGSASHVLHHPVPLMYALVSLIYKGVLDRFPDLRVGFLEGGCAWMVLLLDRMARDEEVRLGGVNRRLLPEYLTCGQVLVGCEGDDESLPYLARRVGIEPFAYSSDYPHEVDLPAAKKMIEPTVNHPELTQREKAAVLAENARRFFRL
jgi:predicted TIM-barrel fold metal-dependent hydrolase